MIKKALSVVPLISSVIGTALLEQPCLVLTDTADFSLPALKSALKAICKQIAVKSLSDKSVHLNQFGVDLFSNLVLLIENGKTFKFPANEDPALLPEAPTYRQGAAEIMAAKVAEAKKGGRDGITHFDLLKFFDSGHNVLLAVKEGSGASSELNLLLKEFGMTLSGADKIVANYLTNKTETAPLKSEPWSEFICGPKPVKISGSPIGLSTANKNVFSILRAEETAFHPSASHQGSGIVLAAANQALNGARFTAITSLSVFKENNEFSKNILSWTFGKRGLLRARDLRHHRVGETTAPRMYKEKDEIEVALKIEELKDGQWIPFPASDVQIEFVMLDPHVRNYLEFTGTEHKLVFTAPDVYGIFKFKVDYNRRGFNPISVEQVAPVRNPWHNDYPRFLLSALPYYGSCFVTLILVIIFSAVLMNHRETEKSAPKEARHRA